MTELECSRDKSGGSPLNSRSSNGTPPINDSVKLDRSVFNRTITLLAVGVPCDRSSKSICEKLRPYFLPFLHIPKLTHTYTDSSGLKRRLMLVQPPDSTSHSDFAKQLQQLNVDTFTSHCTVSTNPESASKVPLLDIKEIDCNSATVTESPKNVVSTAINLEQLNSVVSPGVVNLNIGYKNCTLEQVLDKILPESVSPISGFTVMGHVAHFNLKPEALPYRHVIGQAVMDKIPHIRTVVHKAHKIESEYRVFELDLMAGEPDYVTTVRENGLNFQLDISKVYWNSRLGTEHTRIVDKLSSLVKSVKSPRSGRSLCTEPVVVYDVFAGVGPFAVPAARSGCRVFANDLNPDSYKWLLKNIEVNKSRKYPLENITCYNLDGREFIRKVVLPHYWSSVDAGAPIESPSDIPQRYFVLMNLPALAPDFLDAFLHPQIADELLPTGRLSDTQNNATLQSNTEPSYFGPATPLECYCYCFVRQNVESEKTVKERVAKAMASNCSSLFGSAQNKTNAFSPRIAEWHLRFVRNVAPYKDMFCAEFKLYLPQPQTSLKEKSIILQKNGSEN